MLQTGIASCQATEGLKYYREIEQAALNIKPKGAATNN